MTSTARCRPTWQGASTSCWHPWCAHRLPTTPPSPPLSPCHRVCFKHLLRPLPFPPPSGPSRSSGLCGSLPASSLSPASTCGLASSSTSLSGLGCLVCPWVCHGCATGVPLLPQQTDPSCRPSLLTPSPNGGAAVPPFAGSDLVLSPSQWSSHVVGEPRVHRPWTTPPQLPHLLFPERGCIFPSQGVPLSATSLSQTQGQQCVALSAPAPPPCAPPLSQRSGVPRVASPAQNGFHPSWVFNHLRVSLVCVCTGVGLFRLRAYPGKLSPWMDLDSRDPVVRQDSEQTLKQELSWASHLSLQVALYPTP